jgi:propanol-preferring alcohol dehydrogenase
MVLDRPGTPLRLAELPVPQPGAGQILVRVSACGVCRTDLHVVDGELTEPALPIVPGHEVVGRVVAAGADVERFRMGERVGIPWLGWTCGVCSYCRTERENLCDTPKFTGYQINGGYAEYALADARYCFPIQGDYSDAEAAPLMCAGLIGYRSLATAGRRTSWRRWRAIAASGCTPSPARATTRRRRLRAIWAQSGSALPTRGRPSRSMLRSSSRR